MSAVGNLINWIIAMIIMGVWSAIGALLGLFGSW